ncbi:MAG: CehA/McbA family metallohydrolase [Terriglobia bacterium]
MAEKMGERLAEARLVHDDGSEHVFPVRRRFEVSAPSILWGHLCYAALPHLQDTPRKLTDPLSDGTLWGYLQYALQDGRFPLRPKNGLLPAFLWVWAAQNSDPSRPLKSLRLEALSDDPLVVCGLTLYHGRENPLRVEPLSVYRLTLPEAAGEAEDRWELDVDLGVVARTYALNEFHPDAWLAAPGKGLGERNDLKRGVRYLYAEVTANPDATLVLRDTKSGASYEFDLAQCDVGKDLEARPTGARVEIIERDRTWVRGQVVDSGTGRPTPVRLAFRSKEGRYIPPYGHRTEINDGWFQDYGADIKLMDTSFAYLDGTFQVELPVGDVYVEITKGFEYQAVRKKLTVGPNQRELNLEISRITNSRSQGWVTADTHVHFLSPSTAILEGQAEGLNLINLLAAQWGDLFTNVGDIPHGPLVSRDGETIVQMGTENRQHVLGHLGLLGARGEPVYPLSAAGPQESYLGDALWNSLADWADDCRDRNGLVITAHFPYPAGEAGADIVLGKTDALELYPDFGEEFNNLRFLYWYRVLNCGYRLPIVAGTDKMAALMPVGASRTYAHLGQQEFTFDNWAKAIRSGNTFMTSGPLLFFHVDGHASGEAITLGAGGATVEVRAEARCFVPIHRLEIVLNGRVVASRDEREGAREMTLTEKVQIDGPGWLAARCFSRTGLTTAWGFKVLAHTSPVYLQVPGQDLFSEPGAAFLMTLIEGAQTWVETLATRPDAERLNRIRKTLNDASNRLHQRMHQHGVNH